MTTSPESTRPATRRELRERSHSQTTDAFDAPLPAFGNALRPPAPGLIEKVPFVGDDTETAVQPSDPPLSRRYPETMTVNPVEPDAEPDLLGMRADETADAAAEDAADDVLDEQREQAEADLPGDDHDDETTDLAALLAEPPTRENVIVPDVSQEPEAPQTAWADENRPPTALTWLDASTVSPESVPERQNAPDLFAGARLVPGWLRPRVLIPVGIVAAVCGSYAATTLLWPLNAVAPTAATAKVEIAPAAAASVTWPAKGSAAVGVQGIAPAASTTDRDEIASISKVVSVLMVLDELPLQPGEQGPSFDFDWSDANDYWQYRSMDQSSLDVPVGGSLTEYQMLQGVLLGSANNYIDRLADEVWGSEWGFSQAADEWLADHGLKDIRIESPSGFNEDNIASPAALLKLGELAMKNPVFAEIVGTRSAEIPGVGNVTNTNQMLDDPGVVGIKTGTLSHWNLLTAKDVPVGDSTVRVYTSVLGQDDNKARLAATRQLFADVEKSLAEQPIAVPKGTVVGHVSTEWGERINVVTDADAQVVLWNGATATAVTDLKLGDKTDAGARVGTLTAEGPIGTAETSVSLAEEITPPSIWWRLTHPLELLGLDND
ncbi:D-alanyl-D-alanine carboxypeptidase [Microbacterium sp. H1-D42]|uniref:D-alanyl-D-alanine carboxypeptidase family protein n=1 Tax=Microbacterium sp. H1-D42 TaxID=2925844 RepID=UPI001F533229|nr:D-alanyl-D-alanine carboxypeptidase [Microbacterium sp. H1-D42]UNK71219.1 D-alanyl-D-alanine carboxypeptidase [Microbacterium sp. H1-D42]